MKTYYKMMLDGQEIFAQDEQILQDLYTMEQEKRIEQTKKEWEAFEQRLSQYRTRRACSAKVLEELNKVLDKNYKLTPVQKSVMTKFKKQQTTKHYIALTTREYWAFQRFFYAHDMGWVEYPYKPLKLNQQEYPHFEGNLNIRKQKTKKKFKEVYVLENPAEFYV